MFKHLLRVNLLKRVGRPRTIRPGLVILLAVLLLTLMVVPVGAQDEPEPVFSPYQSALMEILAARSAAGLPVPASVTYTEVGAAQAVARLERGITEDIVVTTVTQIVFDNPQQAGYDAWPAFVVAEDMLPGGEGVVPGNYTELYRAYMETQVPGYWDMYDFGQEPRTYTIVETWELKGANGAFYSSRAVNQSEDVLMGFTFAGPDWDYTIGASIEDPFFGIEIASFRAGFALDYGLGMRLPVNVNLSGPSPIVGGQSSQFSAEITTLDWSPGQYSGQGIPAKDGNEFVFDGTFFVGVKCVIAGFDACGAFNVDTDFDQGESFVTPLGAGSTFDLPAGTIPVKSWGVAGVAEVGVGVVVTPKVGSDEIVADWESSCGETGTATFTEDGEIVSLGPVTACSCPATKVDVTLDNFRYKFTEWQLQLGAALDFSFFGYGVWDPTISIISFDLSNINIPGFSALSVGKHAQCDNFNCGVVGPDNSIMVSAEVACESSELSVVKQVDWGDSTPDLSANFEICISGPSYPQGTCKIIGHDGGTLTWEYLLYGDYSVWEEDAGDLWDTTGWGNLPVTLDGVDDPEVGDIGILNTYVPPVVDPPDVPCDEDPGCMNPPDGPGDPPVDPVCADPDPIRDLRHGGSHLNAPGYSSGVIENLSDACVYKVGIASYQMVDNTTQNQVLFDHAAGVIIGPGESVNLSVSLPGCAAQVDLFYGNLITAFGPGIRYDERLLDGAYVDWGNWCVLTGS